MLKITGKPRKDELLEARPITIAQRVNHAVAVIRLQ
jgi:hypothetical protein